MFKRKPIFAIAIIGAVFALSSAAAAAQGAPVSAPIFPGPDGNLYRVDTYIQTLAPTGGGVQSGRDVKRITVVVTRPGDLTKILTRLATTVDLATGCIDGDGSPAPCT